MELIGSGVEYGLHCLLWLATSDALPLAASSRDLADLQGISTSFTAKIMPKLERAGIVAASQGVCGGYRLAKPADRITVMEVVDAIEGLSPIFRCREVRRSCALFVKGQPPPPWATEGVCAVHAVMLRAEQAMRAEFASTTLAELAATTMAKVPTGFDDQVADWLVERIARRRGARTSASAPG